MHIADWQIRIASDFTLFSILAWISIAKTLIMILNPVEIHSSVFMLSFGLF